MSGYFKWTEQQLWGDEKDKQRADILEFLSDIFYTVRDMTKHALDDDDLFQLKIKVHSANDPTRLFFQSSSADILEQYPIVEDGESQEWLAVTDYELQSISRSGPFTQAIDLSYQMAWRFNGARRHGMPPLDGFKHSLGNLMGWRYQE
ncbi:hypothetical protein AWENTII_000758 [Aspergillus wentii]